MAKGSGSTKASRPSSNSTFDKQVAKLGSDDSMIKDLRAQRKEALDKGDDDKIDVIMDKIGNVNVMMRFYQSANTYITGGADAYNSKHSTEFKIDRVYANARVLVLDYQQTIKHVKENADGFGMKELSRNFSSIVNKSSLFKTLRTILEDKSTPSGMKQSIKDLLEEAKKI